MARITTHYNITSTVPFLDVDVASDNRMFLDPHSIRLQDQPQPLVAEARHAIDTFFHEVTNCVGSMSTADTQRGLDLLQHFEEPWETRLGLAQSGFSGHGGAADIGARIWNSLNTDLEALVRVGILRHLEDLALFVEGVDRDITSDITTRIVFDPLVNFTAQVIRDFPEFHAGEHRLGRFDRQVWDASKGIWARKQVELPVATGKPLLLIPRDWARHTLLMSAGRFYDTSVLTYAQLEQAVLGSDGRLLKTPKEILRDQPTLVPGRSTNLRVTHRAQDRDENLVEVFRDFVDGRYEPLTDEEIQRRIA